MPDPDARELSEGIDGTTDVRWLSGLRVLVTGAAGVLVAASGLGGLVSGTTVDLTAIAY